MPKHVPPPSKPLDLQSFRDLISRVPIKEFQHDYVPRSARLAGKFKSWYRRREMADPDMQSFEIRCELTKHMFCFLTRVDWRGLFIPKELTPPDLLLHDYYKDYHEYKKPDELAGEEAIRETAKAMVSEFGKSQWKIENPNVEPFHRFNVLDHKKRSIPFLTRTDWRGIWVHEIIARDDLPIEPTKPNYRLYKTTEEAKGETEVRRMARAYLAEAENLTLPSLLPKKNSRLLAVKLTSRQSTQLADIRNYLSIAIKAGVSEQATLKWLLDKGWEYLLPDDYKTAHLVDDVAPIGTIPDSRKDH